MADPPMLIFDGDCGFCTSAAGWIARGWPPPARAVPWQHLEPGDLARVGLSVDAARRAAWWVSATGRVFEGHRAVAEGLCACSGWRHAAGTAIRRPPGSWAAAAVYPLVVRYRHRLPGGTPACRSGPVPDS